MAVSPSFASIIPEWPPGGAPDVPTLLKRSEDDPGALSAAERAMVTWLFEAQRVAGQLPLNSLETVRGMLFFPDGKAKTKGSLKAPEGKWTAIPIDQNRHRILDFHKGGGRHWRFHLTSGVPTVDDLPTIPPDWRYLLIAGGLPEVMVPDDEARIRLRDVCDARPVADVLFWHAPSSGSPSMWSVRKGSGCSFSGGAWAALEFPTTGAFAAPLEVSLA